MIHYKIQQFVVEKIHGAPPPPEKQLTGKLRGNNLDHSFETGILFVVYGENTEQNTHDNKKMLSEQKAQPIYLHLLQMS